MKPSRFVPVCGKPGLVRAIRDHALAGTQPVPAEQRSDRIQAHESDPRRIIRAWGAFVAELTPRAAPITLLIRDAAITDPDARPILEQMDRDRLKRMITNAQRLSDAGHLRSGITVAHAADILWTYSSPDSTSCSSYAADGRPSATDATSPTP